MKEKKPDYKYEGEHDGKIYISKYYFDGDKELPEVHRVGAVCFTEESINEENDLKVILFHDVDGVFRAPGGGVEDGETEKEALAREILEEANCEMLEYGRTAYGVVYEKEKSEENMYFTFGWAIVKALPGEVKDPCGKSKGRRVFSTEQALEKIDWPVFGKMLLDSAIEGIKVRKKK